MDLRSIINTEGGEGGGSRQNAPAPVTPIQTGPPSGQIFRNYSHSSQASPGPGKHGSLSQSQEYASQNGGPYASPTTYQAAPLGRPPPPTPIQAPPPNDLRSPAGSYSAPSPYRHTSTSSISAPAGQYPFPHNLQNPQSPAQHHQYPPTFHPSQRDSYSLSNTPSHLQQYNSPIQGPPAPQTPPIGIPGAPHHHSGYLQHQRSQSSLSNSTPTSAHSQQQQYQNQFIQDSPVSASQYPPSQLPIHHQRQQSLQSLQSQPSQPGTPLGPPLQTQRQLSGTFAHPTSPYQQRGAAANPFTSTQYNQTSPAPPNASIPPRNPTTPRSAYDSQRTSTSSTQQRSMSERERSLSVSPKTRLPSQTRMNSIIQQQPEEFNSSTKRKMEDREMSIEAPQRVEQYGIKSEINGDHQINSVAAPFSQPPKKRIRYAEPPIWARSAKGMKNLGRKINGRQQTPQPSVQASPSVSIKQGSNGLRQESPAIPRPVAVDDVDWNGPLGPWEPSIAGKEPPSEMTKLVADWLYMHVVNRDDTRELASRGVEIEVEAKLGQLVSKETNQRLSMPIRSETVLMDNQFISFKSTMTEVCYMYSSLSPC